MKFPPREVFKAKLQIREHLKSIAYLKKCLGPGEIDPTQKKINRKLGISDEDFLKYNPPQTITQLVEERVRWISPEDFANLTTRIYGAPKTLEETLADPETLIYGAQEALTKEYRVAAEESLAGIQKKDIDPLLSHLFFFGPSLLRVRLRSLQGITEFADHQANRRELNESQGITNPILKILC